MDTFRRTCQVIDTPMYAELAKSMSGKFTGPAFACRIQTAVRAFPEGARQNVDASTPLCRCTHRTQSAQRALALAQTHGHAIVLIQMLHQEAATP